MKRHEKVIASVLTGHANYELEWQQASCVDNALYERGKNPLLPDGRRLFDIEDRQERLDILKDVMARYEFVLVPKTI